MGLSSMLVLLIGAILSSPAIAIERCPFEGEKLRYDGYAEWGILSRGIRRLDISASTYEADLPSGRKKTCKFDINYKSKGIVGVGTFEGLLASLASLDLSQTFFSHRQNYPKKDKKKGSYVVVSFDEDPSQARYLRNDWVGKAREFEKPPANSDSLKLFYDRLQKSSIDPSLTGDQQIAVWVEEVIPQVAEFQKAYEFGAILEKYNIKKDSKRAREKLEKLEVRIWAYVNKKDTSSPKKYKAVKKEFQAAGGKVSDEIWIARYLAKFEDRQVDPSQAQAELRTMLESGYFKQQQVDIDPGNTFDFLSAIYAVRNRDFQPGDEFDISIADGKNFATAPVKVAPAIETIEVNKKTYQCYKIIIEVGGVATFFKYPSKSPAVIWYTADESKIPAKIVGDIPMSRKSFADFEVTLKSSERPAKAMVASKGGSTRAGGNTSAAR